MCRRSVWICKEQAFWLVSRGVLLYTVIEEKRSGGISSVMIPSSMRRPNSRAPIGRLFIKVFLWFWLTALALFAIFLASRMVGTRVVPPTDVIASFAPKVADEAAHAYESGGPHEFEQFERGLVGKSGIDLYLIDGYGKDVLSRPIPQDSLSIVRSARSDGRVLTRYGLRSHSSSYKFTSPTGHPYVLLVRTGLEVGRFLKATAGGGLPVSALVLLMVTFFCFWLTHHIVAPIQEIQSAARRVAAGDLNVRAPVEISGRHDELAALAADFDVMVERMSAFVRSQKDLLSTVSHELRSPLTRLIMSLALLRKQSPESEQLVQRMERDVERVDTLMGQLLTLARLETGVSSEARDDVDLSQLVQEVVADGDFEARSGGKSVRLEAEGDIVIEKADQQALRSACENIVRNAIRFTAPASEVKVILRTEKRGLSQQAVLSVRDHGPGVPGELLQQIFEPFFRAKEPSGDPRANKGTGLGLAIALEAIRQHRGTIIASNASPVGLEVKITLPSRVGQS
jgi:two-component system, OmpR family, sensor histidine kinase CpxA